MLVLVLLFVFLVGCGAATDAEVSDGGGAELYPQVEAILERSCAYQRCHAGPLIGAMLSFAPGTDYASQLVSIPACEYERMARVEPFEPEQSWLWVKLTADFRDRDDPLPFYIHFEPEPGWDPDVRGCRDRADDGTPLFGQRMPLTAPNMLPEAELELIREWIARGARR